MPEELRHFHASHTTYSNFHLGLVCVIATEVESWVSTSRTQEFHSGNSCPQIHPYGSLLSPHFTLRRETQANTSNIVQFQQFSAEFSFQSEICCSKWKLKTSYSSAVAVKFCLCSKTFSTVKYGFFFWLLHGKIKNRKLTYS